MKRIVLPIIAIALMVLPIKVYSFCEKCHHWHVDSECVVERCDCNKPIETKPSIRWSTL